MTFTQNVFFNVVSLTSNRNNTSDNFIALMKKGNILILLVKPILIPSGIKSCESKMMFKSKEIRSGKKEGGDFGGKQHV